MVQRCQPAAGIGHAPAPRLVPINLSLPPIGQVDVLGQQIANGTGAFSGSFEELKQFRLDANNRRDSTVGLGG
jgi:hypothetical protein